MQMFLLDQYKEPSSKNLTYVRREESASEANDGEVNRRLTTTE